MGNIVKIIFTVLLVFILYSFTLILMFKWIDPPITAFIQQESEYNLTSFISPDSIDQQWVSIQNISDNIKLAVIASEDQKFISHSGFDIAEIEKAIDEAEKGKRVRGASTITQQAAKNLFLFPSKIFFRKIFEAYYTFIIEILWSKKRILEVYLNIAEFGDKIYGIEAASIYYFKKSAKYLNQKEAALLAAILPNPKGRDLSNPSEYLEKRTERILINMHNIGGVSLVKEFN
ncbi:MAG: monofunctional biosynthetic peptidoglycan transglycosylase [Melioribacteraceae bacterium]|nr:monofunctional biosynthetic peptidoglycan transglycosylase [Melioribacteraceae bacterium]